MELNLYFTGAIVAICAIHLATVAVNSLTALLKNKRLENREPHAQSQKRDDWYVFFHCSDLLGKESGKLFVTDSKPQPNFPSAPPCTKRETAIKNAGKVVTDTLR